jgi:hypothetical protein
VVGEGVTRLVCTFEAWRERRAHYIIIPTTRPSAALRHLRRYLLLVLVLGSEKRPRSRGTIATFLRENFLEADWGEGTRAGWGEGVCAGTRVGWGELLSLGVGAPPQQVF